MIHNNVLNHDVIPGIPSISELDDQLAVALENLISRADRAVNGDLARKFGHVVTTEGSK